MTMGYILKNYKVSLAKYAAERVLGFCGRWIRSGRPRFDLRMGTAGGWSEQEHPQWSWSSIASVAKVEGAPLKRVSKHLKTK